MSRRDRGSYTSDLLNKNNKKSNDRYSQFKSDQHVGANGFERLPEEGAKKTNGWFWFFLVMIVLLTVLGIFGLVGFVRTFSSRVVETVPEADLLRSTQLLFEGFLKVDAGFNDPSRFDVGNPPPGYGLGLTVPEIAPIGFYGDTSTAIAYGPFMLHQSSVFPNLLHDNHSNQPGAFQSFGVIETSFLQSVFEGSLFNDTHFPWFPNPNLAPRLYHVFPEVTSYLGFDRFTVNAIALVNWGPNIGNNFNNTGIKVAQVASLAQYKINRDTNGDVLIPSLDWIHFTLRYED